MGSKKSDIVADWHIDPRDMKAGDELGRGSFGVVRLATWRHTPVAMKILYTDAQKEDQALFEAEVAMMATLHHPNIVQFLGFTRTPQLTLVIEYFPEGSLEDYVKKNKSSAKTSLRFCFEMALAIEYLHSRSPSIVIHRDIKPPNFLLTASHRVKLGDFGIARTRRTVEAPLDDLVFQPIPTLPTRGELPSTEDLTSNCGTIRYMAPEVASPDGKKKTTKYSAKADIFSLALVYYFVWERILPSIPFHTTPASHFLALHEGKRPPFSSKTPHYVRDFIKRMWLFDPNDRPTASELLDDILIFQNQKFSTTSSASSSSKTRTSFFS